MAAGMVDIVTRDQQAPRELFIQVTADGLTAFMIVLSMAFGLILPKMCIDHFTQLFAAAPDK